MSFEIIEPEVWASSGRNLRGGFDPLAAGDASWHDILFTLQGLFLKGSGAGVRLVAGKGFKAGLAATTIQSYAHRAAKEFPGCRLKIHIVRVDEGQPATLLLRMETPPTNPIPAPTTETAPEAPREPETAPMMSQDTPPAPEAAQELSASPLPVTSPYPTAT
jgi:hypothetical protein